MHSVPRLMPGQGFIVGVGAIGYPAEYEGADPQTLAELGVSKVVTLTSTYDHRIIQGAESGEFLAAMHDLLLGERRASTTRSSPASACPTSRRAGRSDHRPVDGLGRRHREGRRRCSSSSTCTACAATSSPTSTRSGCKEPHTHPELDPIHWGLTIWDLDREFPTGGLAGRRRR